MKKLFIVLISLLTLHTFAQDNSVLAVNEADIKTKLNKGDVQSIFNVLPVSEDKIVFIENYGITGAVLKVRNFKGDIVLSGTIENTNLTTLDLSNQASGKYKIEVAKYGYQFNKEIFLR